MDEREVSEVAGRGERAAETRRTAHSVGVFLTIVTAVVVSGFGLQAFLGTPDNGGSTTDRVPAPAGARVAGAAGGTSALALDTAGAPGPDQQAAFLESVRVSGTGGWSSRLEVLGYGMQACRLLDAGRPGDDVARALVAAGEQPEQATVVVAAAPRTLCPPVGA